MVNRKRLKKYLDKQWSQMQRNLDELSEAMDEDKLHDLRLHAKKVKAVSGFLKESTGDKKKYSTKKLKELFHAAGDTRTAQLNLKTLEDHAIKNESFEKGQLEVIEKSTKVIAGRNEKFNKNISILRRKIAANVTAVKNNSVIAFYYDNIKILSNNFKVIDESKLHDSRKIIKMLLYDLKILPADLVAKININKDYLDNLQKLIGDWHDTVVTLDQLISAGTVEGEGITLLRKQKQDQLEIIIRETRDFDSNVMFARKEPLS